ncbi:MAG: TetR/AcrR family transcriptional regulator [Candidatus Dormibacterales bacterium]
MKYERRQQLVDAAWRCAARRGFQATTVDDVCAEAGVSKGAFYGYFEQKQDLLLALLEDDARFHEQLIERLTVAVGSGAERLRAYARATADRSSDPARVQVNADLWTAMLTEAPVRQRFAAAVQHRRERLRTWIEEAHRADEMVEMPANAFASILVALTDGLVLHGSLQPSAFRWTNIQSALDVLLRGISS